MVVEEKTPLIQSNPFDDIPIFINVYDMDPVNEYLYPWGLGIYHSGLEILGQEFSFGGHPYEFSGVFAVEPKSIPGVRFREALFMGTTHLTHAEIRQTVIKLAEKYQGNSYSLFSRNCNHFVDELAQQLCGKRAPSWINRAAFYGKVVHCLTPNFLMAAILSHIVTPPPAPSNPSNPL